MLRDRLPPLLLATLLIATAAGPAAGDEAEDPGYLEVRGLMQAERKERKAAAKALIARGDRSLLPALVDALFFIPAQNRAEALRALAALAGEDAGDGYQDWVAWIGAQRGIEPAPGYAAFKLSLLERIDPRYKNVFYAGAPLLIRLEEVVWGGVRVDGIPPLESPAVIPADAAEYLREDERVFGVEIGGQARAYPLRMLDWHEMLNDTVGGQPITLSYCTLCGSAILYDARTPAGGAYTFGTSGLLYRSNKLMYDRQSWSLWSNITGEAVVGRAALARKSLPILPMTLTTWGAWKRDHPATTTLALDQPAGRRAGFDYRPGAADRARRGVKFPVWQKSDVLARDVAIYALEIDGAAKAYPIEEVIAERVINDALGGRELVLVAEPESAAVRVYERAGRRFAPGDTGTVAEQDGGRVWRVTEQALVPADGGEERLARLPGHVAYWFGWYGFYPDTELYRGAEG